MKFKDGFRRVGICFFLCSSLNIHALELEFIADFNVLKTGDTAKQGLGGLSGLSFDETTQRFLAISDDRSFVAPARYYDLKLEIGKASLGLLEASKIELRRADGSLFPQEALTQRV